MKEFIDKLIGRLREESYFARPRGMETETVVEIGTAISIVNELAEEYNKDYCEWKQYDENDIYYTGCEKIHMFIDGSPTDNKYEFCPYCGKKIKVAPYTEGE